jgi:glycosyltransferase involved in cell wall biosynthesis
MKVSVVTPSFNSARFIRETIQSVISQQGSFSIEYIVVDNLSTDSTNEIIDEFQRILIEKEASLGCEGIELIYISEQDEGMYDAINKGFAKATGDIFSWLNADDIYLPGALATIAKVFTNYEEVHWLKGITSYITEETSIWKTGSCFLYTQNWIQAGVYGREHYFIQQDSVFWRAWLWKQSGGIDTNLKLAGDYYLWIKFAELVPLITVKAWLSCFRTVKGQLSANIEAYRKEMESISSGINILSTQIKLFFRFERVVPSFLKPYFFRVIFGQLDFSVILISSDGVMQRINNKYYEGVNWL